MMNYEVRRCGGQASALHHQSELIVLNSLDSDGRRVLNATDFPFMAFGGFIVLAVDVQPQELAGDGVASGKVRVLEDEHVAAGIAYGGGHALISHVGVAATRDEILDARGGDKRLQLFGCFDVLFIVLGEGTRRGDAQGGGQAELVRLLRSAIFKQANKDIGHFSRALLKGRLPGQVPRKAKAEEEGGET